MEVSDNSSEDEYDVYINAASKLNVLNNQSKLQVKLAQDNDDDNDEDNNSDVVCTSERKVSPALNVDKTEFKCMNDSYEMEEEINESEDDIVFVPVINNALSSRKKTTSKRTTRNSNKTNDLDSERSNSTRIEEDKLDVLCLSLTQEEEDTVIIGSPPPPTRKIFSEDGQVSVKILWKSDVIERFDLKMHETFQKVFKHFAEREKVSEDQILIMDKTKRRISPFDTPMSVSYSIAEIYDGGIISAPIAKKYKDNPDLEESSSLSSKIKIQTSDKRTLTVSVKVDDTFEALLDICSKQLDIPKSKVKFYFDGELIDISDTPKSLDLDKEECFDLKISN